MGSREREEPSDLLERLIVARHDLDSRREDLVAKHLEYDELVRALAPLAPADEIRQIYHDAWIPGRGDFVSMLIEIWPDGTVHLSDVERGHLVRWPDAGPDGAHAATDAFPIGDEGEMPALTDEVVKAALKDEELGGLWDRYRDHITAGPGRDVP